MMRRSWRVDIHVSMRDLFESLGGAVRMKIPSLPRPFMQIHPGLLGAACVTVPPPADSEHGVNGGRRGIVSCYTTQLAPLRWDSGRHHQPISCLAAAGHSVATHPHEAAQLALRNDRHFAAQLTHSQHYRRPADHSEQRRHAASYPPSLSTFCAGLLQAARCATLYDAVHQRPLLLSLLRLPTHTSSIILRLDEFVVS
jgi:hypothetical protein